MPIIQIEELNRQPAVIANGRLLTALAARDGVDLTATLGASPAALDAILAGRTAPSLAIVARAILAFPKTPVARMFRVTA
jgi:hypothetical protein